MFDAQGWALCVPVAPHGVTVLPRGWVPTCDAIHPQGILRRNTEGNHDDLDINTYRHVCF